jgi:hypothetical protein
MIKSMFKRTRTPRRRRWLVAGLAAALVHQLGACPCGCLEGNLWLQTALRVAGHTPPLTLTANASRLESEPHADAQGCDETHADLAYVGGAGHDGYAGHHLSSGARFAPHASVVHEMPRLDVNPAFRGAGHELAIHGPPARTLRAQLQVFLI